MPFGYGLPEYQAAGELAACRQAMGVDNDGDVVALVHLDVERPDLHVLGNRQSCYELLHVPA